MDAITGLARVAGRACPDRQKHGYPVTTIMDFKVAAHYKEIRADDLHLVNAIR